MAGRFVLAKEREDFVPRQAELPVAPPKGTIVLFDGGEVSRFVSMSGDACNWTLEVDAIVSTPNGKHTNHNVTNVHFRDAEIHVEFQVPDKGEGDSGVYFHGEYELQIRNSFGFSSATMEDEGTLYGFAKPLVNASRVLGA